MTIEAKDFQETKPCPFCGTPSRWFKGDRVLCRVHGWQGARTSRPEPLESVAVRIARRVTGIKAEAESLREAGR